MSPENQLLEDVFPIEIVPFRGDVSFRGCRWWFQILSLIFYPENWGKSRTQFFTCANIFRWLEVATNEPRSLNNLRETLDSFTFSDEARTTPDFPKKRSRKSELGGGNSNMFYFHPENWGNDPI